MTMLQKHHEGHMNNWFRSSNVYLRSYNGHFIDVD